MTSRAGTAALRKLADMLGLTEALSAAARPEYPMLTVEGIRAAAAYGAELGRDEYPAVSTS